MPNFKNSQILPSFSRIKNKLQQDQDTIRRKLEDNTLQLNEMFDMCRSLTQKSITSVSLLYQIIEELARVVEKYESNSTVVVNARHRVAADHNEWSHI